jgi:hypothetical protein
VKLVRFGGQRKAAAFFRFQPIDTVKCARPMRGICRLSFGGFARKCSDEFFKKQISVARNALHKSFFRPKESWKKASSVSDPKRIIASCTYTINDKWSARAFAKREGLLKKKELRYSLY